MNNLAQAQSLDGQTKVVDLWPALYSPNVLIDANAYIEI